MRHSWGSRTQLSKDSLTQGEDWHNWSQMTFNSPIALVAETVESLQWNHGCKETQVPRREGQVDFIIVIRMYRDISVLVLISFLRFNTGAVRHQLFALCTFRMCRVGHPQIIFWKVLEEQCSQNQAKWLHSFPDISRKCYGYQKYLI